MANEEKSQDDIAAELLERMASSRQSVADSVHEGDKVVGLENIHIEGTDIDFSSVQGGSDAPADDAAGKPADDAAAYADDAFDADDGLAADDAEEPEETGFAGEEDDFGEDVFLDEDEEDAFFNRDDGDDPDEDDTYGYDVDDDPYEEEEPRPKNPKKKRKRLVFTVKSAYGDEARTMMYVNITKSRKIYRWVPDPVEPEEEAAENG
ncbi:hypothetical protein TAMA11512_20150 [Selenomonas sp. TAMA-11512]|uniref:hypothetical protein n=1 Tax=Selenomonas sp. TAMA-11512 TaxID=3095337 RepID=UPI003088B1E0|nr:hypothetical protein TAMA11512_20150 [Selenomonas sp. TAMA-11512]